MGEIVISLLDLGIFLAVIAVLVVGAYLVITLKNANQMVMTLNRQLQENEKNIHSVMYNLSVTSEDLRVLSAALRKNQDLFEVKIPESLANIHAITTTLKNTGEKVDSSMTVVNDSLMETAATVTENTQDVLTYIKIVSEGIRVLIDTLRK